MYLVHAPLPHNLLHAGRGTVGIFLDMDHPSLGRSRLAMTSAHVAFSELGLFANSQMINDFNTNVDFAHYEQTQVDPYLHALDFCVFEVSSDHHVQNIVGNSPRLL